MPTGNQSMYISDTEICIKALELVQNFVFNIIIESRYKFQLIKTC